MKKDKKAVVQVYVKYHVQTHLHLNKAYENDFVRSGKEWKLPPFLAFGEAIGSIPDAADFLLRCFKNGAKETIPAHLFRRGWGWIDTDLYEIEWVGGKFPLMFISLIAGWEDDEMLDEEAYDVGFSYVEWGKVL